MTQVTSSVIGVGFGGALQERRMVDITIGSGRVQGNGKFYEGCRDKTPPQAIVPLVIHGAHIGFVRRSPAWKLSVVQTWMEKIAKKHNGKSLDANEEYQTYKKWVDENKIPKEIAGPGIPMLDAHGELPISCEVVDPSDLNLVIDPHAGETIARGYLVTPEQYCDTVAQDNVNIPVGSVPTELLEVAKEVGFVDCFDRVDGNEITHVADDGTEMKIAINLGKAYGRIVYLGEVVVDGVAHDAFTFTSPFSLEAAKANLPYRIMDAIDAMNPFGRIELAGLYEVDKMHSLNPPAPELLNNMRKGILEMGYGEERTRAYLDAIPGNFRELQTPTAVNDLTR